VPGTRTATSKRPRREEAHRLGSLVEMPLPFVLRLYQMHHGISERELAQRLGVALHCVHDWCKGRRLPRPMERFRLLNMIIEDAEKQLEELQSGRDGISDAEIWRMMLAAGMVAPEAAQRRI